MKIKLFLMSAFAVMALASCSKEPAPINPEDLVEGESTMATVRIIQAVSSRVAPGGAATPTATEAKVSDACIYIFNTNNVLEKKVILLPGTMKSTFEISAGTKKFLVAANYGAADNYPGAIGDQLSVVSKNVKTVGAMTESTTADHYWMSNTDLVKAFINAKVTQAQAEAGNTAATNYVSIPIGRTVAKIACDFAAGDNDADQPGGRLTNVSYTVRTIAKKSYLQPFPEGTLWETPNFNDASVVPADYLFGTPATNPADFKAAGTPSVPCTSFFYATENRNKSPKVGNTTHLIVKGTFTPKVTQDASGQNNQPGVAGATFWRVVINNAFADGYFREKPNQAGIDFAIGAPGVVSPTDDVLVEYVGGASFYRMVIADNKQTDPSLKNAIKRNTLYWVTITSVSGSGANAEDGPGILPPGGGGGDGGGDGGGPIDPTDPNPDPDPENPLETETWMKGEITIAPWSIIDQSGGI